MTLDQASIEEALKTLGTLLESRGLRFELVAVGGGSLMLLGFLSRPTKDIDIVALVEKKRYVSADPLPAALLDAARDVGATLGLDENWLNAGPADLLTLGLPEGFESRTQVRAYGGLVLHLAGRFDQICFKLYASVDRGPDSKHFADLQKLRPSEKELITAARWARSHDVSEPFHQTMIEALAALGVDGHDRI